MEKKSISKNYIYNLAYQILLIFLPLITTPYVSRVLGAENIGIYGYTLSIVTYFVLFGALGVTMYAQREIAYVQNDIKKRSKIFFEIVIFRFITMAISIVIYYLFFIRGSQYQFYYLIFTIELVSTCFDISWFFQGLEEFKKTVLRNIVVKILSFACILLFVKTENDLAIYILIYVLSNIIGNLSLWLYLPKYIEKVKIKELEIVKHLKPTLWLFIPQIAMQIYTVLDKTMIGNIIEDKAEVGYYEQAQKIIKLCLTIVTSLGTVMVPRMANTFASGDKQKLKDYMCSSFRFVYFLSLPIMVGLVSISSEFVPIFFGNGYEKVVILINIISPIILFIGISNIIGTQYLLPTKKQKSFTISVTAGAIVNFTLNIILIRKLGALGASIATVVAEILVTIIQLYSIRKDFKIKDFIVLGKNNLIAVAIMIFPLVGLNYLIKQPIVSLILQISVGAVAYMGTLFVLKDEIVVSVIEKIKKRGILFMEKIKKINIEKLFIVFLIIQPIIDIITSLLVRHVSNVLTLGIFVRAIFMVAIILYSFIISDKKYRIKMFIYYGAVALYSIFFTITMYQNNGTNMLFSQLKGLIKCFYLPIIMVALFPVINQEKVHLTNKTFIYTLLGYTITIFLAKILGIAYPTYSIGLNVGTTGLFYAANEIGIILGILAIFLFNNMFLKNVENIKDKILYVISMFLYIFSILEMGTKVPILAFAGVFAICFIVCVIKIFTVDKKLYLRKILEMICIVIIIGVCLPYTAVGKNIERNYGINFFKILDITYQKPSNKVETIQEEKKFNSKEEVTTAVVSGRNLFLKNNIQKYNDSSLINKAVGIGYADKNEDGYFELKTVEIDYFDIFFLQGIIGFILFFIPIIVISIMIIKRFFNNFKKVILNEDIISMITVLGLSAFVAMLAGHTLVAPAVSIYIAIIFVKLNNDLDNKKKEEKDIV